MRNSKLIFSAAIAISAIHGIGAASAADLPARTYTKAPAVVAEVYNWTGFYVGGNVGGAWERNSGTTDFTQVPFVPAQFQDNPQSNSLKASAVIGGIHAGYNWQLTQWVVGVEADWDWTGAKNSFCRYTDTFGTPSACRDTGRGFLTFSEKTNWLGSARARLGYAWDRVLVYGTGGAAWGQIDTSINASCLVAGCGFNSASINATGNFTNTKVGWVAGAGIEAALTGNWIVRAEYLHYDLGNVSDTFVVPPGTLNTQTATWSRHYTYEVARAGISYKFGGPVVAKY